MKISKANLGMVLSVPVMLGGFVIEIWGWFWFLYNYPINTAWKYAVPYAVTLVFIGLLLVFVPIALAAWLQSWSNRHE